MIDCKMADSNVQIVARGRHYKTNYEVTGCPGGKKNIKGNQWFEGFDGMSFSYEKECKYWFFVPFGCTKTKLNIQDVGSFQCSNKNNNKKPPKVRVFKTTSNLPLLNLTC